MKLDELSVPERTYWARVYGRAADLIRTVGLYQGFYWPSGGDYRIGDCCCAIGALTVASGRTRVLDASLMTDRDSAAMLAVEVLIEKSPAEQREIGALLRFSDQSEKDSRATARRGSRDDARRVEELFHEVARRLTS